MRQDIKEKWVKALRSGEYTQGTGNLKSPQGEFCCLGVLCDLIKKDLHLEWESDSEDITCDLGGARFYLSAEVKDYIKVSEQQEDKALNSLAVLNDRGTSFSDIANKIEQDF